MKFGLHYLLPCADHQRPEQRFQDTLNQATHAETLGFESVWPVEHHFHPRFSVLPCPTLLLAAIAARTRQLRLGTAIVQLALAHPLRVAEEIATLDVLSGGRVELGIGRGSNPAHFAGYGVPMEESRERMAEGLTFLRRAFTEERFSHRGRFFQADDVCLTPKPLQGAGLRVHLAANSVETAEQAGQGGYPIMVAAHVLTFAKLRDVVAAYDRARAQAGHAQRRDSDLSLVMPLYVGETEAQIERELGPSVRHYVTLVSEMSKLLLAKCTSETEREKLQLLLSAMRQTTYERVNGNMGLFATPRQCVEQLQQIEDELGAGRVIGWFNFGGLVPHERVMRSMELFASEVMPHFARRSRAA
jgi:alkanesulfonate monooxygenase SsuD/methylene tetrahydromethanopterin reductase-like flavin-dependent oxidoreductase (luciferase family)